MGEEQALQVIKQGIDLATGAGAFKSTQDVAILNQAVVVLSNLVRTKPETETANAPAPRKTKK